MPYLDNNSLDDPVLLDGNLSFSGGQLSGVRPTFIPDTGYSEAKNMDFDIVGNVVTRRGTAQLVGNSLNAIWNDLTVNWETITLAWSSSFATNIRDIFYFDTPAGEFIAVADGDNLIKLASEALAVTTVSGSTVTGDHVYFAQLVDRLYYCDGVSPLRYINGSLATVSIPAGKVTSVDVTNLGSGYTSVPNITMGGDGGGTGATFLPILGPNGKVVAVDVLTQGSGYARSLHLTVQNAPSGGTTATCVASVSETPSMPKLLVSHTSRLFCTSANTSIPSDTLFCSDVIDGESWSLISNSLRVGGGDGDPIVALLPWHGFRLLVFKERSIWYVDANPAQDVADWEVKLINNRIGCIAPKTPQQVGADVLFLARDGVRSLSTIESGAQTSVTPPLSTPVNNFFERANKDTIHLSTAVFHKGRYIISIPSGDVPDTTLVYNAEFKAWSGYWTGWQPNAFTITGFGGKIRMAFGDSNGRLFTWLDYLDDYNANESYYLDQSESYESHVLTRALNFKEEYGDKFGYQAQFEFDNRLGNPQSVFFSYLKDMGDIENGILQEDGSHILAENLHELSATSAVSVLNDEVSIPNNSGLFRKSFNLQSHGRFSCIQFFVGTESGRLSLHSAKVSAFSDTIRPER